MTQVGIPPALGLTSDQLMRLLNPNMARDPIPLPVAPMGPALPGTFTPAAMPLPQAPAAPALTPQAPLDPFAGFDLGGALANYGKTWSEPGFASQYPFPRGDQNTPFQNVLAGFGNNLLNLPQNIWNLGSNWTGASTNEAVSQVGENVADWFTQPEGQAKAEEAAKQPPAAPSFTPGLPSGPADSSSGGPTSGLNSKIIQVESGGNNFAKNPMSSAYGPGQFTKGTWMEFVKEQMPEVLKQYGEKAVLEMRADPKIADQAVAWYAGKGVDALDKLNLPATDTNLYLHHFLGTQGMTDLLSADPSTPVSKVLSADQIKANSSILGNGKTVQDVIDWSAAKMGEGAGLRPTPRPAQEMPDFAAANSWFDQAAPTPMDEQLLKDAQLAVMLEGIGAGLGSVDASRQGGGALFAALAKGSGQGARAAKQLAVEFDQQFKEDKRAYAEGRGKLAWEEAGIKSEVDNANAQTEWLNSEDQRNYDNATIAAQQAKFAAKTPKIIESSDKGLWVQDPNGNVSFIGNESPWDSMDQLVKTFGVDSNQARQLKYNSLAQTNNILAFEMEIVKDLLNDGLGPSVWGDAYTEAMGVAEEQLPPGLQEDPAKAMAQMNKILSGLLMGASQSTANYDWVQQAAAFGHPGALMLMQGGTFSDE